MLAPEGRVRGLDARHQKRLQRVGRFRAALRFTIRTSGLEALFRISAWSIAAALRHAFGRVGDWPRNPAATLARREARATRSMLAGVRVIGRLKGAFAKAGQFATLRHDLLPASVHLALTSLRDRVPPLPAWEIRRAVEREFGARLEERFASFDEAPLGAASIAQVHGATLLDGTPVAVKVQYPWLEASLPTDLAIVRIILTLLASLASARGRSSFDPSVVMREFAAGLREEVDFRREARIAEEIAQNLAGDDSIVVPTIYPAHSTRRVLTMSLYSTLKVDRAELQRAGVDCRAVLETLARAYAKQVFVDGLFHADPHSGNLFVIDESGEPDDPNESDEPNELGKRDQPRRPRVLFVDFGLSKRLDPALRDAMRRAIYSLLQRDSDGFVDWMDKLGMIAPGSRAAVHRAVTTMLARISDKGGQAGLLGVAGGQVLGLKDEAKALLQETPGLQLPSDLLLYAKTLSYLFALGEELDPEVDLLKLSTPYLLQFLASKHQG